MNNEIKNDKVYWIIAELIFIALYVYISGWYTSYPVMETWLKVIVWIMRIGAVGCIVISWLNITDPNYEKYRRVTVMLLVALSLIIALHHSLNREDNQVLIDSKENAVKP